jgi:hypothetical protein
MHLFTRRGFVLAGVVTLALSAAACGDNEPEQRKAFIEFLQTRIVDKPGVHVPRLTGDEKKSFGPYVDHFAVITAFTDNPEMVAVGAKMQSVAQRVSLNSVQDLVDHRAELKSVKDDLAKMTETMNRELAKTVAARAALKQPDDLKAIYDKAFDKDAQAPVRGFNETVPLVIDIAEAALKLGDYIDANRGKVTIQGRSVGGRDPQTAREVDILVKNLAAQGPKFQDAQRRLRIVLQGS